MSDAYTLSVVAAVIIAVVLAIVRFGLNPVLALALGAAGIGLLTGLGPVGTVESMTGGFGEVMMEAGLLIAWGVLIGALLNEMGAVGRLVETLLRVFGKRGVPYALGLSFATYLQTIFIDAMIVIAAPLARRIAPRLGRVGTGIMGVTFAISLEVGIVMMVPGFAAVAVAGVLGVPLGTMLLGGFVVVVPTVVVSILLMSVLFRMGLWNPATDEQEIVREDEPDSVMATALAESEERSATRGRSSGASTPAAATAAGTGLTDPEDDAARTPLLLMFGPMLAGLLLIAVQAVLSVMEIEFAPLMFLGDPVIALLLAVIGTAVVARLVVGQERVEKSMAKGFQDGGQIFVLTGVGGALAAVIAAGDLGTILEGLFSATAFAPLLLVWVIAAALHIAVGSVTLSAITAAGILAPVASTLGLNPLLLALAAGAGALFCIHVTSNTFWLLQSFLGQSVRGALKTVTLGVSVASVVALGFVLVLSLFI